jgi:FkbM family methyltransferase
MNNPRPSLWQRTLLYSLWSDFQLRWRFKYTLPKLKEITLEGVKLDVSPLPPVVKNALLVGRYELHERNFAARHLTAADTVLEAGGAIGFVGLFCQTRLGITKYTTVEANPGTVELLKRNYALNGRTPVVWNVALAKTDGKITLNVGERFYEDSVVAGAGSGRTVEISAFSLPRLIARLDYQPTTLILDVEGAEQFVDFTTVPPSVKKIIMELHPAITGFRIMYQIVADLVNQGFRVEDEKEATFFFIRE